MALQKFRAEYPSQRDAATELGISQAFLNDMLNGKRNVSKRVLSKLGLESVVVKARNVVVLLLALCLHSVAQAQDILPITVPVAVDTVTPKAKTFNVELSIFASLQAADIVSTRYALNRGAFEANPLQRWVVEKNWRMVAVKGALTLFVVTVVKAAAKKGLIGDAKVVMWIVNIGTAAIVANNVRIARGLR